MSSDDISIRYYKDGKEELDGQNNKAGEGVSAGLGAVAGGAGGLLAGLGIMAIPGAGPIVAAGGLAGAMIESDFSEEDAHVYAEGIHRGGAVVAANVENGQSYRS